MIGWRGISASVRAIRTAGGGLGGGGGATTADGCGTATLARAPPEGRTACPERAGADFTPPACATWSSALAWSSVTGPPVGEEEVISPVGPNEWPPEPPPLA